ncbi:MAG: hypothetical protein CSA62_01785 [Planctomycetota bacterium]|nr:MAG: hypothetical protein CSA62_01785 [Planctomycetota bacterium]
MLMLPPISFEGEILGRQLLRWKRIIEDRDRTHEGEYKEMAKFGLDRFLGARSVIGVQGGKLVEELEFHFEKSSGAGAAVSPFEVFSPSDGGLARAAASLPDNTVAALHMTLDGNRLQSFLEELTKLMYMPEARRLAFFHYLRMMLGCVESTSKPKAQEPLPEKLALTAFVLPPEQSFFPEFLIAVDVGDRKVDRKGILTRVAGDLSDSFGGDRSKLSSYVKSLGQGEDAIPYVKLSRLLQSEGSVRGRNLVLGGRYLALGQMGSSLIYGTHPRAIRKLKLSIANGETLASRKGFQARFPEATRNPIGLYLDAENLGEAAKLGLKVVNSAALQGALLALLKRAKGSSKQYIPNWASLIKMIDDHSIVGEETEYGLRLVFKGNGLLSPSMWAAIAYAMDTVNGLAPMLPATAKKK